MTSARIPLCFNPFRIEYSWEGCFEYDRVNCGHSWHLSDKSAWKRLSVEIKRGDDLILQDDEPKNLCDLATSHKEHWANLCRQKANLGLGLPENCETEWQFLQWLIQDSSNGKQTTIGVGAGLSLVLNALIRRSTTKPFYLLASFVDNNITVEVHELGDLVPSWFYLELTPFIDLDEYLVCFPELFLDEKKRLSGDVKEILNELRYVRCKHHYDVVRIEQDAKKIKVTLRDRGVISQYFKGKLCGCIPIPGKRRKKERQEPQGVNTPEVVVSSPVVGKALMQLSRIWQDPHAKSVLISSPPGSGKDALANSIPVGNGRPADKVFALSMASDDQKGLERRLYGFAHPDGSIQEGMIAKASDAALFLDEVHQPENGLNTSAARASLLRTLEAGTYSPLESANEVEVKNVLWVMATSKTLRELEKFKPLDFWTRMTYALAIPHPLDFDDAQQMPHVVADFFRVFWWDFCDKQYQIDPTSDPNQLSIDMIPAYWQQRSMLEVILYRYDEADDMSLVFAKSFLTCLRREKMKPYHFSIRGIRSVVSRLFAIACSNVAQGKKKPLGKIDDFKEEIVGLFDEIKSVAQIS